VKVLATPRPLPSTRLPALAGGAAVALALPVFVAAGWRLSGWVLGAILWAAAQGLGLLLARLPIGPSNLAGSGVQGIGMMFRAAAVMVVVIAVAVSDANLALAAAGVYALGYTLELALSLLTYFSGEPAS
jgi:hypothetical protein